MAPIYSVVVLRKNPPGSEKAPSEKTTQTAPTTNNINPKTTKTSKKRDQNIQTRVLTFKVRLTPLYFGTGWKISKGIFFSK